jgi:hypothetical protein
VLRIPILILLALSPSPSHAGLRETLTSALGDYCVPKANNDVEASFNCSSPVLAIYDSASASANKCRCDMELGLYYDATRRKCVECEYGYLARTPFGVECTPAKCPANTFFHTTSECPAGFRLAAVDGCASGQYRYYL